MLSPTWLTALILIPPLLALLLSWPLQKLFKSTDVLGWVTVLLSGISLLSSVALATTGQFPFHVHFILNFYLDALSIYFLLLVNLVAFLATVYTIDFLRHDAHNGTSYHSPVVFHLFFNAFHLTMLLVPMVNNLIILWMAIELTTLASTLLVRYRRQRTALEAAWKYIIITTAGIIFALFGIILLTSAINDGTCLAITETLNQPAESCHDLTIDWLHWSLLSQSEVAQQLDQDLVMLSFLFVLIGYGTKAGLAPMHTWLPDGHGEAPSPVSALLSGVLLKSALYAILRFYTITNLNQGSTSFTSNILLFAGLFSLVLATPFILKQNKFKRVLAYHSLEHMGIIVFAIGIGGSLGLFAGLLHSLNHALTKALMFLTYGHIRRRYNETYPWLDETSYSGILKRMPLAGMILLFGGLGLVGSPPFNIFLSEFIILWAALQRVATVPEIPNSLPAGVYVIAIVLFLVTVTIIFGGLVVHLSRLLLGAPPVLPSETTTGVTQVMPEAWWHILPLLILLVFILFFWYLDTNRPD
jgi:hydrogenase-4 component F